MRFITCNRGLSKCPSIGACFTKCCYADHVKHRFLYPNAQALLHTNYIRISGIGDPDMGIFPNSIGDSNMQANIRTDIERSNVFIRTKKEIKLHDNTYKKERNQIALTIHMYHHLC